MKTPATDQKLRGGYYTPEPLANFLTRWAIRGRDDVVLEPSSGDGVFLKAALARFATLGPRDGPPAVDAVEIEPQAAASSRSILGTSGIADRLVEGDFFAYAEKATARYDAVLGNPPFLRFQHFREEHRQAAFNLMRAQGLAPNRLTNAWVPFVAASAALLAPAGRLAMVLPAELLQVSYAAELRQFLSDFFARITVVTFERLVFDGIQQEVVLLLAERRPSGSPGIRVVELHDASDLSSLAVDSLTAPVKRLDHSRDKWTQYFLAAQELELLRQLRTDQRLVPLGQLADTDVGVVTGMNDFFVLGAEDEFTLVHLVDLSTPIISRSNQLSGAVFEEADWRSLRRSGVARALLTIGRESHLSDEVETYLETGVVAGVDRGYKCRIRRRWYEVPSVWRPDAFLLRQIHLYPQLVINRTPATSTDTVHRLRLHPDTDGEALAASFHNAATFLFAEAFGRSYGGGVLELEPSEADALLIPYSRRHGALLGHVDDTIRRGTGYSDRRAEATLLNGFLGLDDASIDMVRRAGSRLRDRRLGRKSVRVMPDESESLNALATA